MSKGPFEYSGGATGGGDVTSVFGRTGDVVAENGDYTASQVTNVPAGNISSTDVQGAINELDTEKAPTFTVNASLTYAANVLGRAALTGDVTASAGSNATTVANVPNAAIPTNTISLSKLVNASAQFDIVGRKTASGGAWEDCTRTDLKLAGTDLANTFTASQTINLASAAMTLDASSGRSSLIVKQAGVEAGRMEAAGGGTSLEFTGVGKVNFAAPAGLQLGNVTFVDSNNLLRAREFTVSTLPSASGVGGAKAAVSDSLAAPVFAATLTGGGSVHAPVYSDNSVWRYG